MVSPFLRLFRVSTCVLVDFGLMERFSLVLLYVYRVDHSRTFRLFLSEQVINSPFTVKLQKSVNVLDEDIRVWQLLEL